VGGGGGGGGSGGGGVKLRRYPPVSAAVRRRLLRGLSQERLARKAGVSWSYVNLILNGYRRPSVDVVTRLAKALKVSFEELRRAIPSLADRRNESR